MERIKESEYRELFEEPEQQDKADIDRERFQQLQELRQKHLPDTSDIEVDHTNWGKSISQAQSQDIINKPEHYHLGGIDAIEILETKFGPIMSKGFFLGNVIKYVLRYQQKGGIEDLEKAKFYLDALIRNERGQSYKPGGQADE